MTEQHRQWLQKRREKEYPWMNDDQFECWCMFCELLHGGNHQFGKIKPAGPDGITVDEHAAGGWATYDFDNLTRAVVMAHDRCIRFYISPCNRESSASTSIKEPLGMAASWSNIPRWKRPSNECGKQANV